MELEAVHITVLTTNEIIWPYSDKEGPHIKVGAGRYPRRIYVNPFPCYPHDWTLVQQFGHRMMALWPVPFPVRWYLLYMEDNAHTNGWFQIDADQYDGKGGVTRWVGAIALQGKRIPIHPAMTRYVVAHEYGHAVEEAVALRRGQQAGVDAILGEYRELRGLPESNIYGAGHWHTSVGEVFANDFRVLVAKVETEYWPHPGVTRPEDCPAVVEWWESARLAALKTETDDEIKAAA